MTHASDTPLQRLYEHFAAVSPTMVRRAADVVPVMQAALPPAEWSRWAQYALELAQCGWRTWESADAFLQVSPFVLHRLSVTQFWAWADQGLAFAHHAAEVATAFFQATRPFLQQAMPEALAAWMAGGSWYVQQQPALPSLAVAYFQRSPDMYGRYALTEATLWGQGGHTFARTGLSYGRAFFAASQAHLEQTPEIDHVPAWELARSIVSQAADVALAYLERYAELVRRLGPESQALVRAIVLELLAPTAAEALAFLRAVGPALGFLPVAECLQALAWCQQIAAVNHASVRDFLEHFPALRRRLPGPRLQPWVTTGIEIARGHAAAGQAYFALESTTAHERLQVLQSQVAFAHVEPVLQLYTEALLGRKIPLRTTADLPVGLHTASGRDLPTSDGATIYVPTYVDDFATAPENFAAYKVAILHQVGFYECATFTFSMAECVRRLPAIRQRLLATGGQHQERSTTAFGHFFAAFPLPNLARRLFTICEDARIDAHLARSYKGIRADLQRLMRHSLRQRPLLHRLPLRHALLEGLLQLTLGAAPEQIATPGVALLLQRLAPRLQPLGQPAATVYDTAAAVLDLYLILTQVPEHAAASFGEGTTAALEALDEQLPDDVDTIALADLFRAAGESGDRMPELPESTEPAEGMEPVPYRGDMKPELLQKTMRLQELAEELGHRQDALSPLSPELLKDLLEHHEIEIKSLQAGDLTSTSGLFVTNLEGRNGTDDAAAALQEALQQERDALQAELLAAYGELTPQSRTFLYDEWDYLIGDYRRHWCRLTETVLGDEGPAFVDETRQKYAALLAQVSQQLQLLKPEMFKKLKRLTDGEEIDLDSAIEALVDRRAGSFAPEKVYMRRVRHERSVAAVFLLDMSASTDDEIKDPTPPHTARQSVTPPPPRPYDFSGFIREDYYAPLPPRGQRAEKTRRRIIDVEKEALVLMAEALADLGDAYAVYGFSGYGRDQVDLFVVKEFAERYDARIQGRIAAIKPHRSTRMGPAIRHALTRLERQEARLKTLVLLSDGYPQDYDYGKDRKSKEYGLQDTMMALYEARLKGIQTFCITVDPAGHDYLRRMCPDHQYLVIEDVAALPKELPKVYRGLTV